MAKNKSRGVRQREIIDAVFVCNRGGFQPTIFQIAKITGMSVSPQLRMIVWGLEQSQVLHCLTVPHRPGVVKKTYSVNMLALRQADSDFYKKIRAHWPTMFPEGD